MTIEAVLIARCPQHGLHGERDSCFVCGGPVEQVLMAPVPQHDADPRELPAVAAAGPGGPCDRDGVVLDTRHAIIVDFQEVATLTNPSDGRRIAGVRLEGRINRSQERASVMGLVGPDGLAALVAEAIGLAAREGGPFASEFHDAVARRLKEMEGV